MHEANPNPMPRPILKLKSGAKQSPREIKTQPPPIRQHSKLKHKPGALWSDELKEQMQQEMDALKLR
jgi:hypothetical protein